MIYLWMDKLIFQVTIVFSGGVQLAWTKRKEKKIGDQEVWITWHCIFFFSTGDKNIDLAVYINTTNPTNASVECLFFQPEYTCIIDYGTDPSYTDLIHRESSSSMNKTATITLSQRIKRDTTYYYIVSAESSSQCVRVLGNFQAGRYMSFGI